MAEVYFIGDGHFGHKNILSFRQEFDSIEHHDNTIIDNINAVVTERDKIFFMGDWVFDKGALELIKRITCPNKHLVMGNHDDYNVDLKSVFQWISGPIKYKEFWLTHIPVHPMELRGKRNIHGHMHRAFINDHRYLCTSAERLDYKPISLQEIRSIFNGKCTLGSIVSSKVKAGKSRAAKGNRKVV